MMRLEKLAAAGSLLAVAACGGVTVKQHAVGNRIVPVDSTPAEAAAPAPAPAAPSPTILSRPILVGNDRGGRPQVRKGEHDAAPYIDRPGGPRDAGYIIASSEVPGVEVIEARSPYVIDEVLYVKMPHGVTPTPGMHLAIESLGPDFEAYGQVLIPTGEVTVIAPGGQNEATSVRLERQFAEVEPNQLVVPMEAPKYPAVGQRAVAVTDGVKAKVIWVSGDPVQPSLGYYVVLTASERDGVHVGDQFTLLRPRMRDEVSGLWLPEQDIATTQVVRVGAHSSTAVVIAQTMPAISPGADARLTAKMP
ncbi:MAG TPA: hypothetical protein VK807_09760 [Gemmatimonadaceae bacterium]|jgi:hypothetical protein|nr:hypothetical protein [Gemmatimonadaceae bacterium]